MCGNSTETSNFSVLSIQRLQRLDHDDLVRIVQELGRDQRDFFVGYAAEITQQRNLELGILDLVQMNTEVGQVDRFFGAFDEFQQMHRVGRFEAQRVIDDVFRAQQVLTESEHIDDLGHRRAGLVQAAKQLDRVHRGASGQDIAGGGASNRLFVRQNVEEILLGKSLDRFAANVFQHFAMRLVDLGDRGQHFSEIFAGRFAQLFDQRF